MLGDDTTKQLLIENRKYENYLDPKLRKYGEYMSSTISSVLRVNIILYNLIRFNKRTEMIDLKLTFLLKRPRKSQPSRLYNNTRCSTNLETGSWLNHQLHPVSLYSPNIKAYWPIIQFSAAVGRKYPNK